MKLSPAAKTYLIRFALLTAVYASVTYLGLFLSPPGTYGGSIAWPPAAVAVAALFLWGLDFWPALALSFFFIVLTRGVPAPLAAAVTLGNMLEAVAGAWLLGRLNFNPRMSRLGDSLSLIFVAMVITTISASFTSLAFSVLASNVFDTGLWTRLWIGHAVSILVFGPFVLYWANRGSFRKTRREILEGMAVFGSIAVINFLLFWTPYGSLGPISLIYILILPMVWASLRTGPRGISLALFLLGIIGATGILYGYGPLTSSPNLSQELFGIQVLIGTLAIIFLPFTSITEERKEAVSSLERHVGRLENALERISSEDQAKSDFIAILAHELRNPLSPILSSVEIMKQHGVKPENEQAIKSIASNVHIMARLLDDLLDISRITQKKFKLQVEPVEFAVVLEQTLEIVRPLVEARKHTLHIETPPTPVWLNVDQVRLTQALVNLLNNAAKYTDPGGRIWLICEVKDSQLIITVKDTGIGIEPERLPRIFDSFGGAPVPARRPGGLHIGLSLAKRMIDLHHGTIEATSSGPDLGSIFVVRLPLSSTAPLPLEASSKTRRRFGTSSTPQTLDILVVDDNQPAADALSGLLRSRGQNVTVAYSGTSALEVAAEAKPKVALLDIGMPGMDGYELARKLREQFGKNIRLVAITGYGQRDDQDRTRDAGFDAHLVKPVSIADIERVLEELR